jgi:ATP:corrinoid adenosyltransferase
LKFEEQAKKFKRRWEEEKKRNSNVERELNSARVRVNELINRNKKLEHDTWILADKYENAKRVIQQEQTKVFLSDEMNLYSLEVRDLKTSQSIQEQIINRAAECLKNYQMNPQDMALVMSAFNILDRQKQ